MKKHLLTLALIVVFFVSGCSILEQEVEPQTQQKQQTTQVETEEKEEPEPVWHTEELEGTWKINFQDSDWTGPCHDQSVAILGDDEGIYETEVVFEKTEPSRFTVSFTDICQNTQETIEPGSLSPEGNFFFESASNCQENMVEGTVDFENDDKITLEGQYSGKDTAGACTWQGELWGEKVD